MAQAGCLPTLPACLPIRCRPGTLSVGTIAQDLTDPPSIYDLEAGSLVATRGIAIGENSDQGSVSQTGGLATIGV